MHVTRTRLLAVSSATLALVLAGTSIAGAHPGRDDDRGSRFGPSMSRSWRGLRVNPTWWPGVRLGRLRDGFVRHETAYESDAGIVVRRIDDGTVSTASDTGLDYSLATGAAVSVTADDDTQVIGFIRRAVERRGRTRERWVPREMALADIPAGSEVMVWSTAEDGGTFVAQRVVVKPQSEALSDDEPVDGAPEDAAPGDGDADGPTPLASPAPTAAA